MLKFMDSMYLNMKSKLVNFMSEERGDVNVVAIVVLIGVAVMLAILLKDQLSNLITNFMTSVTGKANTVLQ